MQTLRVMSFNVRYAEPTDGDNVWDLRRPVVSRMLNGLAPDVVGMQEPEIDQLRDLDADLPDFRRFGQSRYGNEFEKFSAVYYRTSAVSLLTKGAFWFSETPDEPASTSWLIHKPYAVTWGRFRHLASGREFFVFNSQFPYKLEQAEARLRSAQLMNERASNGGLTTILTGDFNCPAGGPVYNEFMPAFRDAWSEAEDRLGPDPTFHGFIGEPTSTARLDWILYRGAIEPLRYETVTYNEGGKYPSDHFPVMADFRMT